MIEIIQSVLDFTFEIIQLVISSAIVLIALFGIFLYSIRKRIVLEDIFFYIIGSVSLSVLVISSVGLITPPTATILLITWVLNAFVFLWINTRLKRRRLPYLPLPNGKKR